MSRRHNDNRGPKTEDVPFEFTPPADEPILGDDSAVVAAVHQHIAASVAQSLHPLISATPDVAAADSRCYISEMNRVHLALPISPVDDQPLGYVSHHVNLQLDNPQALTLKRLVKGMDSAHVRLKCGRIVQNSSDAIRYILEMAGGAVA